MRVVDLIKSTDNTAFSFEILPPLKGTGIEKLYKTVDTLREFDPKYINITTHRSEYVYNGGFHHSKIMMVDSLFCTVGSTNLNSRSLRYDYEVNAFIFDKETTHELSTMFEHDKLDSTLFTKEEYKKRSGWKRFVGWFANLFTPFL